MSTFKFNFVDEDIDDAVDTSQASQKEESIGAIDAPFRELSIDELIKALPPALSYSPIHFQFPVPKHPDIVEPPTEDEPVIPPEDELERTWHRTKLTLVRRDLFDARFQLIAQDRDTGNDGNADRADETCSSGKASDTATSQAPVPRELDFLDNPSDLLPGVYEGGLKTWECSLDLVEYLECAVARACGGPEWVRCTRILEIGCGTAIPTLYLLHELFSHPWKEDTPVRESAVLDTTVYLQDFNALVLELVTFPNILLTWYISPRANDYRKANPPDTGEFDVNEPGEVVVTPALIDAFRAALLEENIKLRFFAGSWTSLINELSPLDDHFDVILTSETIYNLSSLPTLVDLIQRAYLGKALYEARRRLKSQQGGGDDLDAFAAMMSLESRPQRFGWPICVTAAKVLYFGVGGGVNEFERTVEAHGGRVTTVMERKAGVGRRLIQVDWPHGG